MVHSISCLTGARTMSSASWRPATARSLNAARLIAAEGRHGGGADRAGRRARRDRGRHRLSLFPVQDRARRRADRGHRRNTKSARCAQAADAAPGPVSALAAAIATFAARALRNRRLAWAVIAEPVDAEIEAVRIGYRKTLAAEFRKRIDAAMAAAHVPRAGLGARRAGSGRRAARRPDRAAGAAIRRRRQRPRAPRVQTLTLLCLRALGVVDARARGLVVQTVLPAAEEALS